MLSITRNVGEGIIIGDNIRVIITDARPGKVRIAIDAPRDIRILREELVRREGQNEREQT